ncbi:MAG: glycosyltransferase [Chloroflexota bacterium]
MKVAIVHDWLNQRGGAELVLDVLHEMYPDAPVYTSIYAKELMPQTYGEWNIRTSFMQHLPLVRKHHQPFLMLYPLAFRTCDLSDFDVVISNSSGFCHSVSTPPRTCHINYCLTPPRFLWNLSQYIERERIGGLARQVLPLIVKHLRTWDAATAQGVDYFVGISRAVVARINSFYRREADLIYPPVDTSRFQFSSQVDDYFLVVSRLVPYKRVDLAVKACSQLGVPLVVVGDGRDRRALQDIGGPGVKFTGRLPDQQVRELLSRCRAFIFPGEEDFGIAPVEAQAAGRPVIAYASAGALDTVVEGVTGRFFYEPTPEALAEVIRYFHDADFDSGTIRQHARRFDTEVFKSTFGKYVKDKVEELRARQGGRKEKSE